MAIYTYFKDDSVTLISYTNNKNENINDNNDIKMNDNNNKNNIIDNNWMQNHIEMLQNQILTKIKENDQLVQLKKV